jgi:tetratricopeptide (TPR) repeat protein
VKTRLISLALTIFAGISAAQQDKPTSTPANAVAAQQMVLSKTLGDFLPKDKKSSLVDDFYNEIPANLEQAVRDAAEDNYASSTRIFVQELAKTKVPKERARIMMWLGITNAQEALDYQAAAGWYGVATSSTKYLREAIKIDPKVFEAKDVAHALGRIVGSGWASEGPEEELDKSSKKAEKEKSAIDFYYAGTIAHRIAERNSGYSNAADFDQKALGFFAKSIILKPDRYESWPSYLGIVSNMQMYDLLTTDGVKMYQYFQPLRSPLFAEQGPASLYIRSQVQWTEPEAEKFLRDLIRERPDAPYPPFQLAQIAMTTTPTLAVDMFKDFLSAIDSGKIKLQPREQGYRISAIYKLAFMYHRLKQFDNAIETFEKVKKINPIYAETNLAEAESYAGLADQQTTGPKMLELLRKAVDAAHVQEKIDYHNESALRADDRRKYFSRLTRRVEAEMKETTPTTEEKSPATTETK